MLVISIIVNIVLSISLYRTKKNMSELQIKHNTDEISLIECENVLRMKNKTILDLRKENQSLYKTIDEYTSEKIENTSDVEMSEKTLRKSKRK